MAQEAAEKIASKLYNDKLEGLDTQINLMAELVANKYIPAIVLEVCEKFPTYIGTNQAIQISTRYEKVSGCAVTSKYILGMLSFKIPNACHYLKVSNEEYEALRRVYDERERVKGMRDACIEEVRNSIIALKCENKLKELFPEALDYIEFPAVKALPAPKLDAIRTLLKNSKKHDYE